MDLFDLMATISLDTNGYYDGISDVQSGAHDASDAMGEISDAADETEGSLNDVGDSAGTAADDISGIDGSAGTASNALGNVGGAADNASGSLGDISGSAGNAIGAFGDVANSADDTSSSLGDFSGSASDAGNAMGDIGDGADDAADAFDNVSNSADDAADGLDDLSNDADDAADAFDDVSDSADDAADSMDDLSNDADDAANDLDAAADSADALADSLDDLSGTASNAIDNFGDLSSSLGGAVSGSVSSSSYDASDAMDSLSGCLGQLASGNVVGAAIGACAGIVEGVVGIATEAQDAEVIIAQSTGATGDELHELEDIAEDALSGVQLSAETNLQDVAANLGEVNTRLGYTGEDLETTTTMLTDFANITGQDGVTAVDLIADSMSHWHMEAEDMPGLLDDITTTAQNSGASAQELEQALSDNAAAFSEVGFSAEDALAFMGAYVQAGGDASDSSGILKTAINNLNGQVDDVPGTFELAIQAIKDADSAEEAYNTEIGDTGLTVEDVFGTKNTNKMIQNVQSEQFSIEDMTAALEENEGQMEDTVEASKTFGDTMSGIWQDLKGTVRDVGDWIGDTASTVGSAVGNFVSDAASGIGNFFSGIFGGWNKGLDDAAEESKESGEKMGENVKEGVEDSLDAHSPSRVLIQEGQNAGDGLAQGMDDLPQKIQGTLDNTISTIDTFGDNAEKSMSTSASDAVKSVDSVYSDLPGSVDKSLDKTLGNISSFNSDAEKELSTSSTSSVSDVSKEYSGLPKEVGSSLDDTMKNLSDFGDASSTTSMKKATEAVTNMEDAYKTLPNVLDSAFKNALKTMDTFGDNAVSDMKNVGKQIVQGLINGMSSMNGSLYSSVRNQMSQVVSQAKSELGIHSPSSVMADEVGAPISEGVAQGIEDASGDVNSAMEDMLSVTGTKASGSGDYSAVTEVATLSAGIGSLISSNERQITEMENVHMEMQNIHMSLESLQLLLNKYYPELVKGMQVTLDTGQLVSCTVKQMDAALGKLSVSNARRMA